MSTTVAIGTFIIDSLNQADTWEKMMHHVRKFGVGSGCTDATKHAKYYKNSRLEIAQSYKQLCEEWFAENPTKQGTEDWAWHMMMLANADFMIAGGGAYIEDTPRPAPKQKYRMYL